MEAWKRDYWGGALSRLLARLTSQQDEINSIQMFVMPIDGVAPAQPEKIVNIVRSHGMGKSRLVSELAKRRMMVSFVLRKPGETAFPPGDAEVSEFLLAGNAYCMQDSHTRAICLLVRLS